MWLGAAILAHDSNFTITGWSVTGGTAFATREFLSATIHDSAFITEASKFELIHAPQLWCWVFRSIYRHPLMW